MKVSLVEGPGNAKFPFSNCLLVETHGVRILVDTGCSPNLPPGEFKAIVYTHFHPDHIRGFSDAYAKAEKVLAPIGEGSYKTLKDLARRFAPGLEDKWLEMASSIELHGVPRVDEYYEPGEDLCVAGVCIKTIAARGHLLTHTLIEVSDTIYLVDIDLTGFGPWYANPEASPALFLADIEMAASLEARSYATAHKIGVFDRVQAVEMLARYAARLIEHAEAVYKLLGPKPSKPVELAGRRAIYRRFVPGFEEIMRYFEANMIEKLLPMLSLWGCSRQTREGWVKRDCDLDAVKHDVYERVKSFI